MVINLQLFLYHKPSRHFPTTSLTQNVLFIHLYVDSVAVLCGFLTPFTKISLHICLFHISSMNRELPYYKKPHRPNHDSYDSYGGINLHLNASAFTSHVIYSVKCGLNYLAKHMLKLAK